MFFIDDRQLVQKILKSAGGSSAHQLREPIWYIRLWRSPPAEALIIYDESSSHGADNYLIDADRSTLRLSTGYPIETYF
jgi:hypothetical protein